MSAHRISQPELESYLWGAAKLLRGLIDAGDYKAYIFPLVFLKRISDVWDEERAVALAGYNGDEELAAQPENYRFAIPADAHWDAIRSKSQNIGAAIRKAMRSIEAANPDALTGVFGDGDWSNKDLLSDATLTDLVEHFSSKMLSLAALPEDELGNGYEYLIRKFADDSGHTAQEFYTNRTLVHLMARMLTPEPGDSVYDPTCGTGGMLISCAAELKAQGKDYRRLRLYGQERNFTTAAISKMNLFLHGIEDGQIAHGDTLAAPAFLTEEGALRTFNVVLANPPYSISAWDREAFTNDRYGRNLWGVPPQGRGDYAFMQHIVASMDATNGRCAILMPLGVLSREDEVDLRRAMVRSGVLEAVVGLGRNLFYNAGMESCVIICRRGRKTARAGKTIFVDASNHVVRQGLSAEISASQADHLVRIYEAFSDVPGIAAVVSDEAILAADANLNVHFHVSSTAPDTAQQLTPELCDNVVRTSLQAELAVTQLLASLAAEEEDHG